MKALVIILACHLSAVNTQAQTFTQRVQQHTVGEGTVTIHHDKAIDDLVNGPEEKPVKAKTATPAKTAKTTTTVKRTEKQDDKAKTAPQTTPQTTPQAAKPAVPQETTEQKVETDTTTATVLKRSYKTTGYRVQAYAGGNTRRDRQRAEQTGNSLRQLFPGEEVYVHFYSPRWICRMGNYRTYAEAREKMLEVRKMGYESATVVKGKITLTR